MPRTNNCKRNNQRHEITSRIPVASNLSPNAPEFIPTTNDESTTMNQRDLPLQPITFNGSTNASNSSGNSLNSNNSETANTSTSTVLANKGQRDLLINLLNDSKVDCVICYERAKNVEPIWSCHNCFQIMHLKCIMVWFIKSHSNSTWRCPACQSNVVGKPNYRCFCGSLPNPFYNNVDTPHSCGQVCGLQKKNANSDFDDCHHKCTLLCHPGPCPQCVVQVLRNCGCGKTKAYAHCGQSTPILCQNICSKILNCKNHVCEKQCHAGKCEPCKKPNTQCMLMRFQSVRRSPRHSNLHNFPSQDYVTPEELRMLGLDPEELLQSRENDDVYLHGYMTDDEEEDDLLFDHELIEQNIDDSEEVPYEDAVFGGLINNTDPMNPDRGDRIASDDNTFDDNFGLITYERYGPISMFFNSNSAISISSASSSNTNTNNSSNNTISSNNNTSNSNFENDGSDISFDDDEPGDELPLDLTYYDPRYDSGDRSSSEEYSEEDRDIFPNSQEVFHVNPEYSDETSYSEDSSCISQSNLSYPNGINSSSTDTSSDDITDASSSN